MIRLTHSRVSLPSRRPPHLSLCAAHAECLRITGLRCGAPGGADGRPGAAGRGHGGRRFRGGRRNPRHEADDLFITVGVFIHWEAKDNQKIQGFNYRATKEAIARAVKGEPKASEVTAKKDTAHHPFAAS